MPLDTTKSTRLHEMDATAPDRDCAIFREPLIPERLSVSHFDFLSFIWVQSRTGAEKDERSVD